MQQKLYSIKTADWKEGYFLTGALPRKEGA